MYHPSLPHVNKGINQLRDVPLYMKREATTSTTDLEREAHSSLSLNVSPATTVMPPQLRYFSKFYKTLTLRFASDVTTLPTWLSTFLSLERLDMREAPFESLPSNLPTNLQTLNMRYSRLKQVPGSVTTLTQLKTLDLYGSRGNLSLTPTISTLQSLTCLDLSICMMEELDASIGHLPQLTILNVAGNYLCTLPETLGCLTQLKELDVGANCRMLQLPEVITRCYQLERLNASHIGLKTLPEQLTRLEGLTQLDVSSNAITSFGFFAHFTALRKLNLSYNKLTILDDDDGGVLSHQAIEELWLKCNLLASSLKNVTFDMPSLIKLSLGSNGLTHLPGFSRNTTRLINLYTTGWDNDHITTLPRSTSLEPIFTSLERWSLPLSGTNGELVELPLTIYRAEKLKMISISNYANKRGVKLYAESDEFRAELNPFCLGETSSFALSNERLRDHKSRYKGLWETQQKLLFAIFAFRQFITDPSHHTHCSIGVDEVALCGVMIDIISRVIIASQYIHYHPTRDQIDYLELCHIMSRR